jgi:D-arabinose 1-dehydrogenase-like Zn-dependent alcohol dehydrogenase
MRSYQITAWGEPLQLCETDTPVPTGTEVLLRVTACGVCHSDLHIWSGGFDMGEGQRADLETRGVALPLTMGHEPIGEVAALGPEARGVEPGDARIVFPWIGCRACPACERGEDNMCPQPRFVGARVDGGYADHVMVPHPRYLVDYTGVERKLAATYACSGITAYSALKKLGPLGEDDTLLIVGAGGVGLNALYLAPHVHPARIVVADIDPGKRAAAHQAPGVVATVDNADPQALEQLMAISDGGVMGAVDFVGRPETVRFMCDGLARNGTATVVGLYGGAASLPVPGLIFRQVNLRGSYVGTLAEMHELMDIVKTGKIPPIPVHGRPLSEANEALQDLADGKVMGRLVLEP